MALVKILPGFFLVITMALPISAADGQWPAWRGPNGNGTSSATGLPTTWSADSNIVWRLPLPGPGPSTPVVWGDWIYLTAADGEDLVLIAINRDGTQGWRDVIGTGNYEVRQLESNAAAPSPITDGKHIWAMLGTGDVVCYTVEGQRVWSINLQKRFPKFSMFFGMSTTPLLHDGKLYVQLLHANDQRLVALDAKTGDTLWSVERPTDATQESLHSYASLVLYDHGEQPLILVHGADYISAHDPKNGAEIWRSGGLQKPSDYNPFYRFVATPAVGDGLIVAPSAKNGPVLGINPADAKGDITGNMDHYHWIRSDNTPDVPSPVIGDGLVYLCRENGVLICLDAKTGAEVYQKRTHDHRHRSSPVLADGKLYLTAADGLVTVVKAGREFEILAQNELDERTAASPVIAHGRLYLRTYEALYAIDQQ